MPRATRKPCCACLPTWGYGDAVTLEQETLDRRTTQIPIAIERMLGDRVVVCMAASAADFIEPFFVDSLASRFGIEVAAEDGRSLVRPLRLENMKNTAVTRIPLNDFLSRFTAAPSRSPNLIFHTSRCGSTLVTQMLVATGRFTVFSEPTVINQVLDPTGLVRDSERTAVLRAMITALCSAVGVGLVPAIKLRSWNALFPQIVSDAVPKARWVFLHRHGSEVLASVAAKPPGWLRARTICAAPFASALGMAPQQIVALENDEYACRVIGAICRSVLQLPLAQGCVLDYERIGPEIAKIARHFGVDLSPPEHERCLIRMKQSAKNPASRFVPDGNAKRGSLDAVQQALVDELIEPWRAMVSESSRATQSQEQP